MKLWSDGFRDGDPIPPRYAFGKPHPKSHLELSDNRNPHLAWSDLPAGTKSLVLICRDVDVPSRADDVNKEGVTVPVDLPRVEFYHWTLVDVPADASPIADGEFSSAITPRGKHGPAGPRGTRQGINNYTDWFAHDADMKGTYFGYDGPCPPWNDERLHHYHFTLYAIDIERCPVDGNFGAPDVLRAIEGHVLASARIVGTYAIHPNPRTA